MTLLRRRVRPWCKRPSLRLGVRSWGIRALLLNAIVLLVVVRRCDHLEHDFITNDAVLRRSIIPLHRLPRLDLLLLLGRGDHAVDRVAQTGNVDSEHVDCHGVRAHSHATASDGVVGEVDGRPASVADVPRHGARVRWVIVVGAHLSVDADRVHDGHGKAEEDAQDGCPDAHDEADQLDEEDE